MCERVAHAVEYQVQHHHRRRLVADVLCVNRTVLLANSMSQGNNQCTRTCRGVIAGNALHIFRWVNKQFCHDGGNGMGRVVFCIVASAIGIVILDEILEYGGEEIISCLKSIFKGETCHITYQRTAESIFLDGSTRYHV